ncbi:TRADD-N-associated membrane domain-containing protein [Saliterribacillus persicus]|uniref:Cyanobacterial TRADD-N associated 2 transmembrane domain-containing protein n=1 Tax=Saliterribacillus persicus TaxID=930114 RepID=A0A368X951_9BACI|nr:hypothetical protein [Saliterribacillus persicus]RCW62967.1 hypothetical protein DFR57_1214 [Saliterribacillus persicus]
MNLFYESILGLIELLANKLRKNKKVRISILLTSSILLFFDAIILFFYNDNLKDYQLAICIFVMLTSFILLLSSLLAFSEDPVSIKNPFEIELKKLSAEREELKKKVDYEDSNSENNLFNTIQLNLNQTTEYYTINKSQARKSFGVSITAIVAGLITILAGIWFIYLNETITASVISIVSGVLLEIIGGMYFYMYDKSIKQLNYFYGKLEKMQDTMLAIE